MLDTNGIASYCITYKKYIIQTRYTAQPYFVCTYTLYKCLLLKYASANCTVIYSIIYGKIEVIKACVYTIYTV